MEEGFAERRMGERGRGEGKDVRAVTVTYARTLKASNAVTYLNPKMMNGAVTLLLVYKGYQAGMYRVAMDSRMCAKSRFLTD